MASIFAGIFHQIMIASSSDKLSHEKKVLFFSSSSFSSLHSHFFSMIVFLDVENKLYHIYI